MSELTIEAASRTSKNTATRDARALLRQHGFEEVSEGRGNREIWRHPIHNQISVAFDGMHAQIDTGALKQIAEACRKVLELDAEAAKPPEEPLPSWLKEYLPDEYAARMRNGELYIWDKEYPEVYAHFAKDNGNGFAKELKAYNLNRDYHKSMLKELENDYGFHFERNGDTLVATQKDYLLRKELPFQDTDFTKELSELKNQAEACYIEWQARFEALQEHGCEIKRDESRAIINHPELGTMSIALHGRLERLDRKGIDAVDALREKIDELETVHSGKEESVPTPGQSSPSTSAIDAVSPASVVKNAVQAAEEVSAPTVQPSAAASPSPRRAQAHYR